MSSFLAVVAVNQIIGAKLSVFRGNAVRFPDTRSGKPQQVAQIHGPVCVANQSLQSANIHGNLDLVSSGPHLESGRMREMDQQMHTIQG